MGQTSGRVGPCGPVYVVNLSCLATARMMTPVRPCQNSCTLSDLVGAPTVLSAYMRHRWCITWFPFGVRVAHGLAAMGMNAQPASRQGSAYFFVFSPSSQNIILRTLSVVGRGSLGRSG